MSACQPPNKQLERTVTRRRVRAACASFHCAHAARWTPGHAAAQLRRYTARTAFRWTRLFALVAIACVASACSQVLLVEVFNNTGSAVTMTFRGSNGDQETLIVAPGRSAKLWEYSLENVVVSFAGRERTYDVYASFLPYEYSSGRPLFLAGRRVRVQLNSDGTIWAAKPKTRLPISSAEAQPPGFPIAPKVT